MKNNASNTLIRKYITCNTDWKHIAFKLGSLLPFKTGNPLPTKYINKNSYNETILLSERFFALALERARARDNLTIIAPFLLKHYLILWIKHVALSVRYLNIKLKVYKIN